MRKGWLVAGILLCASPSIPQCTATDTVPQVVPVRQISGVVVDSEGLPVPAALIEEYSWNWQEVLISTRTDRDGRFLLVPGAPVYVHYLRVSALGFDVLQVQVDEQAKAGTLRLRLRGSS